MKQSISIGIYIGIQHKSQSPHLFWPGSCCGCPIPGLSHPSSQL